MNISRSSGGKKKASQKNLPLSFPIALPYVVQLSQAPELFDLPDPYSPREACDLHVGGYPYLHLFHHFLRV